VSFVEWLSLSVAFVSVIVAFILVFMMRTEKARKSDEALEVAGLEQEELPFKIQRSVTHGEAEEAKDKLRILTLEREILSYAIRRLYEAQAEGKISEEERDRLAEKYKEDMKRINEDISRGESVIALNELEGMQADLLKLFNERFDDLNKRIEDLRKRSGMGLMEPVRPVEEEKTVPGAPPKAPTPSRERERRERTEKKPAPPEKSEAERKVEQIMAEVEKVLARLEQMEVSE